MNNSRRFLPGLRLLVLALALLLLPAATVRAQEAGMMPPQPGRSLRARPAPVLFWAWVLKVHNGDTVTVGRLNAGPHGETATLCVRLHGLARLDPAQARQARQDLATLVQSHHVLVVPLGFDARDRLVARLIWQGADVSRTLNRSGLARWKAPRALRAAR